MDKVKDVFGSGNICAVCKKFNKCQASGGTRINRMIVRHMIIHYELVVSEEKTLSPDPAVQSINSSTTVDSAMTVPKDTERISIQEIESYIEQTSAYIKDLTLNDCATYSENKLWQECEQFFKTNYSDCVKCQRGHDSATCLRMHVTEAHYANTAIELFGDDSACPICEKLVLNVSEQQDNDLKDKCIKEHMSQHLEEFILGKARFLLLKASESMLKNSREENVESNVKYSIGNMCGSTFSNEKVPFTIQVVTQYEMQTKQLIQENKMSRKERRKFERLRYKFSISNPLWQDCQNYFKRSYPSCNQCQAGHKTPYDMRRHLTFFHYKKLSVRRFGKGYTCPICEKLVVASHVAKWVQNYMIIVHMSLHLHAFIPDEEARDLLLKAKRGKRKGFVMEKPRFVPYMNMHQTKNDTSVSATDKQEETSNFNDQKTLFRNDNSTSSHNKGYVGSQDIEMTTSSIDCKISEFKKESPCDLKVSDSSMTTQTEARSIVGSVLSSVIESACSIASKSQVAASDEEMAHDDTCPDDEEISFRLPISSDIILR